MHFLRYFFAALIATSAAVAQLPPFRFIGLPERHSPTSQTILMNDRILIYSDDETSTWDKRQQRHYVYHRSSGNWSPLPNLDTALTVGTIKVLNDSLIQFFGDGMGNVIWNVDADAFVVPCSPTKLGQAGVAVHPLFGCVQVDQDPYNPSEFSVIITSILDGSVDVRSVSPPGGNGLVVQLLPHDPKGFWLQTAEALWWTERFDTYTKIMDLIPSDQCVGGNDGQRVHVWRDGNLSAKDSVYTFTSPTQSPVVTIIPEYFSGPFQGMVDSKYRVWEYRTGVADGFYVASNETPEPTRISQFDHRRRMVYFYHGPRDWAASYTYSGLMASEDEGVTWKQIPLPNRTNATIDSLSTLQQVEDGGVTIIAGEIYHLKDDENTFDVVGTDANLKRTKVDRWYHRDGSWLGINVVGPSKSNTIFLSDSRGITTDPDGSARANASAFEYRDSVFVRWTSSGSPQGLNISSWNPRSTRLLHEPGTTRRFEHVYTVKELSNGTWFGGFQSGWAFSRTQNVEDLKRAFLTSSLCPNNATMIHANERPDSLVVLVDHGTCYGVITHPLNDLSLYAERRRGLPFGYFGELIEGHDQLSIGLWSDPLSPDYIKDSLYILDAEMMSAKVRRFENITETRVFDIAFDKVNRVYYALTARGLYRSDPVVSSVASDDSASDVRRPASDVPLQTTWYNTLGEHVSPPTTPGLYLKIMIDDKGHMVTEKVAIP